MDTLTKKDIMCNSPMQQSVFRCAALIQNAILTLPPPWNFIENSAIQKFDWPPFHADLGSFTAMFPNCGPWQFNGRFSALWDFLSSNCQPGQFHGHISAICSIHDERHVLKLLTLAVSWPVFSTLGALALKLLTVAVSWPVFSF